MSAARRGGAARLAWLALLCGAPPAWAGELPPPGLYRIDTDGTISPNGADLSTRIAHDGASGDARAEYRAGKDSALRQHKGDGPITHCISTLNGAPSLPFVQAGCTSRIVGRSKDTVVVSAVCPSATSMLTIRQLERDRWEHLTETQLYSPKDGPQLGGMAAMLRQQAQHAPTAEQRAKAQRQLDAMPAMQQELNARHAETRAMLEQKLRSATEPGEQAGLRAALAQLGGGAKTTQFRARAVWTRIADTCVGSGR